MGCGDEDGKCSGSIASVSKGECPVSYDGTLEDMPPCVIYNWSSYDCGALVRLSQRNDLYGTSCFYDPASRELVGALAESDAPSFCDGSSFTRSAGIIATNCATEPLAVRMCSGGPGYFGLTAAGRSAE